MEISHDLFIWETIPAHKKADQKKNIIKNNKVKQQQQNH